MPVPELGPFMQSVEGMSVFRAWQTGGFTDLQVRQLYGAQLLEAFIAHSVMSGQEP